MATKRYGLLDDFGEVIRWVWDRPVDRHHVVEVIKKVDKYKMALEMCGEALL